MGKVPGSPFRQRKPAEPDLSNGKGEDGKQKESGNADRPRKELHAISCFAAFREPGRRYEDETEIGRSGPVWQGTGKEGESQEGRHQGQADPKDQAGVLFFQETVTAFQSYDGKDDQYHVDRIVVEKLAQDLHKKELGM